MLFLFLAFSIFSLRYGTKKKKCKAFNKNNFVSVFKYVKLEISIKAFVQKKKNFKVFSDREKGQSWGPLGLVPFLRAEPSQRKIF